MSPMYSKWSKEIPGDGDNTGKTSATITAIVLQTM